MDWYAVVIVLLLLIGLGWTSLVWLFGTGPRGQNLLLPPGPKPLPIIGNTLLLGSLPHQTFARLAKTYGPLMSIHLGSVYTVVVSSPEMAKLIFQKHGQAFSSRHVPQAVHVHNHYEASIAYLPASDSKWREMRKICKEHMFANHSLEATQGLRRENVLQLLDYVQKCCDEGRTVDLHDASFITTLNLMSATLFSLQATEFESTATHEFKEIVEGIITLIGLPNFADYFPMLRRFDPQGILRKAESYIDRMLGKIDSYVVERLEWRRKFPDKKKNDLLETLVDMSQGNEYKINNNDIRHLLLDLFLGGSETNTTTIEWIMSELLANPDKLRKLKQELRSVVGDKSRLIDESEVAKLPYLQAVVKEALRYHPAGPLLIPRAAVTDQEINGYLIPKGTQILANVWAMARDPNIWANPEAFEPERFLDKSTDFKGHDFELIPFGAGRRICPALPLADRMLHITTAALVHNFDWKLEVGAHEVDHRAEVFGLAVRRAVPLKALPIAIDLNI